MGKALAKQVKYLTESGFTEKQAVALVHYHTDTVEERLATKKDIELLKKDLAMLKKDLIIYMGSIMTSGIVILGVLITILLP